MDMYVNNTIYEHTFRWVSVYIQMYTFIHACRFCGQHTEENTKLNLTRSGCGVQQQL